MARSFADKKHMDIINKTHKPLNVPLPGGKRLFLGPGKTGQVSPKALEHPPLAKLIESGELETADSERRPQDGDGAKGGAYPGSRQGGSGIRRQSGDR
jgi:hypothetical protein